MFKRTQLYQAVAAALFVAASASNPAFAVDEVEPNNQIFNAQGELTAQPLTIGADGTVEVKGAIGVTATTATAIADVDFYAFKATAGDEVKINIDCGMKRNRIRADGTELVCVDPEKPRSVDTILAIFGPLPNTAWVRMIDNTDKLVPQLDDGSADIRDARIDAFKVPENGTGIYVVGVSSAPRLFVNGGGTTNSDVSRATANGSYILRISGVTPSVEEMVINIEVKPGSGEEAPLNPKARGTIPVALISHAARDSRPAFDAREVNFYSLTFGSTGEETSYVRCNKDPVDINADGLLDVVCHFDNVAAKWAADDYEGAIKGKTKDGKAFKGHGKLKVAPKKHD